MATNPLVPECDAIRLTGRTARTLKSWRLQHKVAATKRRGTWWYRYKTLIAARDQADARYHSRQIHHPRRAEAMTHLRANLKAPPSDKELAKLYDVSIPQARAWKRQWLASMPESTWAHTDAEIAEKANTTPGNVADARQEHQARLRQQHRKPKRYDTTQNNHRQR